MKGAWPLLTLLALLLLGPFLLRQRSASSAGPPVETLVIITPHNEATRFEFGQAFEEAYFSKTGRRILVDWRTTGGTSEIARYIGAQYRGSFRNYWTQTLHQAWTPADAAAFDDPKTPPADQGPGAARKAFLASQVGCGVDLFFGGGSFDYIQMAAAGRLVDSGVVARHPELFNPRAIPPVLTGEPLWDPRGCWIGACLGAFGLCYNSDVLTLRHLGPPPTQWADLASPAYRHELALADPTQSGSVAKAFEMLLQQQISASAGNVPQGWMRGFQMIQRIAANARYFTDGATEIPYSVQVGDAAAGMCIDFYGRFESEAVRQPDGRSRLVYVTPRDGSSIGADPIGLFRGAPHAALARDFIEFVISEQGQKLWSFRAGTPGGPVRYTLRRLAIRRNLYDPRWRPSMADPEINPYAPGTSTFVYQPQWTAALFRVISFLIRTAFIDPHDELQHAWDALILAHFPPQATAAFSDLSAIDYAQASGRIRDTLRSPDRLDEVELARVLDEHFRAQYRRAADLAAQGH